MSFLKRLGSKKEEERNKTDDKILEAVLANDPGKVKLLIGTKKFTSLVKPDDQGRTPLGEACRFGFKDVVEILINTDIETGNVQDEEGKSALHIATVASFAPCVAALLKKGVSPNQTDKKGKTPAHYAAFAGQTDILQTLIAYNADTEIRDLDGNTPLLLAAQSNHVDCARALVNHGSNVNAQNRQQRSALMFACQNGSVESAKLFLNHGAKLDIKDTGDRTVYSYAKLSGNSSLIDLFPPEPRSIDAAFGVSSSATTTTTAAAPVRDVFNPFATSPTNNDSNNGFGDAFSASFAPTVVAPVSAPVPRNDPALEARVNEAVAKTKQLESQIEVLKAQISTHSTQHEEEEVNFDSDEDVDLESASKAKLPPSKEATKEIARLKAQIGDLEEQVARTGAAGDVVPVLVLEQIKEEYAAELNLELANEKLENEMRQHDFLSLQETTQRQKDKLTSLQTKLNTQLQQNEPVVQLKQQQDLQIAAYHNLILRIFEGTLSSQDREILQGLVEARNA